ncbi:HAD family hydrolase [Acuticoccus sp. 2012]|uniref:HAD family hydrolase n=2 Tax=Acuticoccus mangrovi TaxID=2796142 RepID=A0A934IDU1_9HYPH|nr:HAD family hydrolase [Acuticoccus mangrovi]
MWSGPRNLSTAMMRSFGARADTAVWDEPFYAAYLFATGLDHPMRSDIIANYDTDPEVIAARCLGPVPGGKPVFYQKHMTHHMVDGFDLGWTAGVTNVFLIREPHLVAASYEAKREEATLDDLGVRRQRELFEREADRLGHAPPVVDATRIANAPEATLTALCGAIGIPFDSSMLAWPAGSRPEDGVWAAHWYASVENSTGFAPARVAEPLLTDHARALAERAAPYYDALAAHAL